jgi:RND family efflux transporter MFP subunit
MAVWKQLLLSLVIVVMAVVLGIRFVPGAPEMLARWGIDWIPVATATTAPAGAQSSEAAAGHAAHPLVAAEPVATATINDRLFAIGTGRAVNSVTVTPFTSGRLTEVLVTSGQAVDAGDVIAHLDSDAEQIAVDRSRLALDDAKAKLERMSALRSSNTVTAVQLNDAEIAMRNAELALRDAELALQRRSIVAPISGVVGIISVSAGNYVTNQTEIATIDDRSQILVDFWVPERFASLVKVGDPLEATSIARPGESFSGSVSATDNRIDAASRTLRVQATITNPADALRAGMSFRVGMRFPGDTYPAVNPLAIQWGTDGAFVWAVVDGAARRTPVRIIQRNTDSVLIDAPVQPGTPVVTEGVHLVREGEALDIAGPDTGAAISEAAPRPQGRSGT